MIRRKKIEDFFQLAKIFPDLQFNVIGNKKYIKISRKKITLTNAWGTKDEDKVNALIDLPKNIVFHGRLNREDLTEKLNEMDKNY